MSHHFVPTPAVRPLERAAPTPDPVTRAAPGRRRDDEEAEATAESSAPPTETAETGAAPADAAPAPSAELAAPVDAPATADTGTLTDRTEFANEARISWSVRERVAVEVAAGYESTTYDDPRFAGSDYTYGEVALRYAYSPKTTLGVAYKFGRFDVDGAGPQDVHRTTARIEWKPREKIANDLELGAEHRSFDNGSDTTPVAEARIGWSPKEGTEIYLNGYRREQASAFLPGQNYTQGGVALGIVQRLGDKWSARLEGGIERSEYARVSGTGPAGREDKIHFIRPALEYRFTDDFSMGLFYRYSENRSNNRAFGYENHSAGIEMGYQF